MNFSKNSLLLLWSRLSNPFNLWKILQKDLLLRAHQIHEMKSNGHQVRRLFGEWAQNEMTPFLLINQIIAIVETPLYFQNQWLLCSLGRGNHLPNISLKMKPVVMSQSMVTAMEPWLIIFSCLNWSMLRWTTFAAKNVRFNTVAYGKSLAYVDKSFIRHKADLWHVMSR